MDMAGKNIMAVRSPSGTTIHRRFLCTLQRPISFLLLATFIVFSSHVRFLTFETSNSTDTDHILVRPSNHHLQHQHQQHSVLSDKYSYPPPLYNISNQTNFYSFWKASHTRHVSPIVLGLKYYREEEQQQQPRNKQPRPPTMLLGIITKATSQERRTMIRQTYLNFYNDMAEIRNESSTTTPYKKICSLRHLHKDCQMAYIFVAAGGTSQSPSELMHPNESYPITTIPDPVTENEEDDIIYLNVREHMNQGKIPTWFKYATMFTHPDWDFDYVAKVDDDTLLFTGNLMDVLERDLAKPEDINKDGLVYGGTINNVSVAWKERNCSDATQWEDCPILGPIWMIGPFYFLSKNLAKYITSDVIDRDALTHVEDVSTASFVWSHPGNITVVEIPRNLSLMSHDFGSNGKPKKITYKYHGQIYGHSEDACWAMTSPYFKSLGNTRRTWREYLLWHGSGQTKVFKYRYQLHNFPPGRQKRSTNPKNITVHHSDYIYASDDFDASPIVLETPYNLVFFPITGVADVAWRCIIRRLLGYPDWYNTTRQFEGLRYLSNYTIEAASEIMSSDRYTRAMFVRNPLDRIQSNYIKLAMFDKNHEMIQGCNCSRDCGDWGDHGPCHEETKSFANFLENFMQSCERPYWRPMSRRMEPRYQRNLDFIGNYESLSEHAEQLLKKLIHVGNNISVTAALGWSETLDELFDRFDDSYEVSDAPDLFRVFWREKFKSSFKFDLVSNLWKYNISLPLGTSRKYKKKLLRKKEREKLIQNQSMLGNS